MNKLLMKLLLLGIAGAIYLLTGRNRRQIEKIPEGMEILCEPPGRRYLVYALGVFVFLGIMLISVLYIMDGAPKEARGMWAVCGYGYIYFDAHDVDRKYDCEELRLF